MVPFWFRLLAGSGASASRAGGHWRSCGLAVTLGASRMRGKGGGQQLAPCRALARPAPWGAQTQCPDDSQRDVAQVLGWQAEGEERAS